jgi:hypothetical protein
MKHAYVVLSFCFLSACAGFSDSADRQSAKRQALTQGYGLLYDMASDLKHVDKLLLVKYESDKVEAVIDDIARSAAKLVQDLETIAKKEPWLNLKNHGLPAIEVETRTAVKLDLVAELAPIAGKTGRHFERTLLLNQSVVLNLFRHLIEQVRDAERQEARRALLDRAHQTFNRLYERVTRLLEAHYFCK